MKNIMSMQEIMSKTVAFAILHYGDVHVTDACVRSILRLDGQERIKIVVVDNDVDKPAAARDRFSVRYRRHPSVAVLRIEKDEPPRGKFPGGFSYGNNVGYAYARDILKAGFIIVCNNDVEFPQKDFISRLERVYTADSDVKPQSETYAAESAQPGMSAAQCSDVCPYVISPDVVRGGTGEHQNPLGTELPIEKRAAFTIKTNRMALAAYPLTYLPVKALLGHYENVQAARMETPQAQKDVIPFGACIIFTPDFAAKEAKAFEPETRFFYEEYLLTLRCRRLGYPVVYDPSLRVLHESGAATKARHLQPGGGRTKQESCLATKVRELQSDVRRTKFQLERTAEAAAIYLRELQKH